jgi:hypothetical protein
MADWVRTNDAMPTFPSNVGGYVSRDELVVPHSELAMHIGAAGRPVVAWACTPNGRSCGVIWEMPDGGCQFTVGSANEMLKSGVRRAMKQLFGVPLAGFRMRRSSRKR